MSSLNDEEFLVLPLNSYKGYYMSDDVSIDTVVEETGLMQMFHVCM